MQRILQLITCRLNNGVFFIFANYTPYLLVFLHVLGREKKGSEDLSVTDQKRFAEQHIEIEHLWLHVCALFISRLFLGRTMLRLRSTTEKCLKKHVLM